MYPLQFQNMKKPLLWPQVLSKLVHLLTKHPYQTSKSLVGVDKKPAQTMQGLEIVA